MKKILLATLFLGVSVFAKVYEVPSSINSNDLIKYMKSLNTSSTYISKIEINKNNPNVLNIVVNKSSKNKEEFLKKINPCEQPAVRDEDQMMFIQVVSKEIEFEKLKYKIEVEKKKAEKSKNCREYLLEKKKFN